MRTPIWALLLTGPAVLVLSRVVLGYDEAPWQPVLYDYYHIDLGELGGNQDQGVHDLTPDHGAYGTKLPTPRESVVNVINDLGIKLLSIHNEQNENNIAISPYGAFSVLAALSEGLQGDSCLEILHAAHIPRDKHVIRVGLRDIHRHLKSYFIPEEGFLAGLTLNLNNVTLRSEYQDVLRFYGFDYGSFNNALYPEPPTTKKPAEGTTLETALGISEGTTIGSTQKIEDTTTAISNRAVELTTELPTTTNTEPVTVSTTTSEPNSSQKNINMNSSTQNEVSITTKSLETTLNEALETSGTTVGQMGGKTITKEIRNTQFVSISTMSQVTTEKTVTSTEPMEMTTKIAETTVAVSPETTVAVSPETTSIISSTSTSEEVVTTSIPPSSTPLETTMVDLVTAKNTAVPSTTTISTMLTVGNTARTTREATDSTDSESDATTREATVSTDSEKEVTTLSAIENVTFTTLITTTPTLSTTIMVSTVDSSEENLETTTPLLFETTPDETVQDTNTLPPTQNNFDVNYNYDVNNAPQEYDENIVNNNLMPNPVEGAGFRRTRSIVDYVIAKFYDDRHQYAIPPQRKQYIAQESPTFAVYGKYRESGVNFMKYDTVLPYFFIQNLNAQALSFPLDSTKYYLLLLLPLRDNGVDQLICDLRLHGDLRYIIKNLRLTHVKATIPSFMLKGYVTLTPTLQRLGVSKIFEPRQADFSPMTNITDIYVTNIEQAVTVTIRNYLDPSAQRYKNVRRYPTVHFNADHPFLYFVVDSELHVSLMVGKVINPLNSRIR